MIDALKTIDSHIALPPTVRDVLRPLIEQGEFRSSRQAVSPLQHALQAASFAERERAGAPLIVAALLHDVGHLLRRVPVAARFQGIDDSHEHLGARWLRAWFDTNVTEPVAMHVQAKRYLCTLDPDYIGQLSVAARASYERQGGSMSVSEIRQFEQRPGFRESLRVRRWSDAARTPRLVPRPLEHFAAYVQRALSPQF